MGGTHPGNKQNACYCNFNCPPGSKPFRTYTVNVVDLEWPALNGAKYFENATRNESFCRYAPDPIYAGYNVEIIIRPVSSVDFDNGYKVEINAHEIATGRTILYENQYTWNDEDIPIDKNVDPGCNANFSLSADVPRLALAFVNPLPEWICDQEQMEEWLA